MMTAPSPSLFAALLVAACGGNSLQPPHDADPVDVATPRDSMALDAAASNAVTVRVLRGDRPTAGVTAYFQNRDSSLAATEVTGADGTATAVVEAGGFVTVVGPVVQGYGFLDTWVDVQPGDQLVARQFGPWDPPDVRVGFTAPIDPGATEYEVRTSCSGSRRMNLPDAAHPTPWLPVDIRVACRTLPGIVVVTAKHAAGDRELHFTDPLTNGSTVAATGSYRDLPTVTLTLSNISTQFDNVSWSVGDASPAKFYGHFEPTAMTNVVVSGRLALGDEQLRTVVFLENQNPLTFAWDRTFRVIDWGQGPSRSMDLAQAHMFGIRRPTVDAPTRRVLWDTEEVQRSRPEAMEAVLDVRRASGQFEWTVVAPYNDSREIVLPDLPAALDSRELAVGDVVHVGMTTSRSLGEPLPPHVQIEGGKQGEYFPGIRPSGIVAKANWDGGD